MADLSYAFGLEPEQAVKYFEGLGFNVPADWQIKWSEAQAKARAIAGIHKQDIAAQIHGALYESMRKGTPFEQWRDDVVSRLKQHDWQLLKDGDIVSKATGEVDGKGITRHRLETIYRTQMQSAYMAGHWQALEDGREQAPWLQYSAILDSRTRQSHRAAHGAVYHIDDPFWDYFYPPNGFNCRCTVKALSERDLARKGVRPQKAELDDVELVVNKKGDTRPAKALKLPDGSRFYADNGFEGNVGKSHLANLGQLQMQRAVELPPKLASVAVNKALDDPHLRSAVSNSLYTAYLKLIPKAGEKTYPKNLPIYLGAIDVEILNKIEKQGAPLPVSSVIASSDGLLRHAMRDIKSKSLPEEFWLDITDRLRHPDAVYLEVGAGKRKGYYLLMFYRDPYNERALYKLVINLDYNGFNRSVNPVNQMRENLILNVIDTGTKVEKSGVQWHLYSHIAGEMY